MQISEIAGSSRRLKIVYVPESEIFDFFVMGLRACNRLKPADHIDLPAFASDLVPVGTKLLQVQHEWRRRAFAFLVTHESFSEVSPGEEIPEVVSGTDGLFVAVKVEWPQNLAKAKATGDFQRIVPGEDLRQVSLDGVCPSCNSPVQDTVWTGNRTTCQCGFVLFCDRTVFVASSPNRRHGLVAVHNIRAGEEVVRGQIGGRGPGHYAFLASRNRCGEPVGVAPRDLTPGDYFTAVTRYEYLKIVAAKAEEAATATLDRMEDGVQVVYMPETPESKERNEKIKAIMDKYMGRITMPTSEIKPKDI